MPYLMNNRVLQTGFTLLEVIIVVIIVGVLMSLAVPRFFNVVEQSRGAEALNNLSDLRRSMVRCQLRQNSYLNCDAFSNLDLLDPSTAPNTHFTYSIRLGGTTAFTLTATRNTNNGGDNTSTISLSHDDLAGTVTRSGSTPFSGI